MSNFDTRFIKFLSLLLVLGLISGLSACQPSQSRKFIDTQAESIIGGENVEANSKFSSRVIYLALGVEKKKTPFGFTIGQKSTCTASALTSRILITAAHCVQDMKAENINAVLSVNPWNHALKLEEWIQVEKVKIHEKYLNKNNEIDNDLALLKLSSDLSAERISQLADLDQVKSENLNLVSIGYGQTSPYKNPAPEQNPDSQTEIQKQATRLNYVNKTLENFDRTAKVFFVDQTDNKGLCFGDSGGPGYIFDEAKQDFYILGITSFVSIMENEKELRDSNHIYNNCNGRGHYTNLLLYKDWISQSLTELN